MEETYQSSIDDMVMKEKKECDGAILFQFIIFLHKIYF